MTSDGSWPRRATLRQFAIFEAIVRSGSAGGAARMLGLSQPAVSSAIARLEQMLGAPLIDRGVSGSVPNEIGTILHRRVVRLRDQITLGISAVCAAGPLDDGVRHRFTALTTAQAAAHSAIASHGSFRAAAQALSISEPALQRTARELERLLGQPLYQRRGQQVVVTRAGKQFAAGLQLGLAEIEQAHDEIEASRGLSAGRVALGCLPLMPKSILARSLGRLLADFPSVKVSLEEGSYDRLSTELRRGKLDLLLGAQRETEADADIKTLTLFDDPYVVIARSGHPLVARPNREALSRQSWVAPPSGTPRRTALEAFFATLPRRPRIVLETASAAMMVATLAESDCLSLSARSQAETDFASIHLAMLDIRMGGATRHVGVMMRSNWLPTTVQSSLLLFLEESAISTRP